MSLKQPLSLSRSAEFPYSPNSRASSRPRPVRWRCTRQTAAPSCSDRRRGRFTCRAPDDRGCSPPLFTPAMRIISRYGNDCVATVTVAEFDGQRIECVESVQPGVPREEKMGARSLVRSDARCAASCATPAASATDSSRRNRCSRRSITSFGDGTGRRRARAEVQGAIHTDGRTDV